MLELSVQTPLTKYQTKVCKPTQKEPNPKSTLPLKRLGSSRSSIRRWLMPKHGNRLDRLATLSKCHNRLLLANIKRRARRSIQHRDRDVYFSLIRWRPTHLTNMRSEWAWVNALIFCMRRRGSTSLIPKRYRADPHLTARCRMCQILWRTRPWSVTRRVSSRRLLAMRVLLLEVRGAVLWFRFGPWSIPMMCLLTACSFFHGGIILICGSERWEDHGGSIARLLLEEAVRIRIWTIACDAAALPAQEYLGCEGVINVFWWGGHLREQQTARR